MEKSGFFNSAGGDRLYNATDFAAYFGKLVSNGVFMREAESLQVVPNTGFSVRVRAGSAWINGYSYENTTDMELWLETANGINPRIDRIVLRWSAINRAIKLAILTGGASSAPTPQSLTRNDDVYEMGLADISVAKGAVTISQHDIVDTRFNSGLCGTVNSLINAVYE